MEALAMYLLKSGALIAMFWLGYHFLLRKETFFMSNRWFLLLGLFTSVTLPLLTFNKVVLVEPQPQYDLTALSSLAVAAPQETFEVNWWLVAGVAYAFGITAFLLLFFRDFIALKKVLKGKPVKQQADFKFVDIPENTAPFSYFSYIVYNSSLYTEEELRNILEHEKVHSDQYHSADVLIARLFCILFWFNPFVWLYKKSILQNLEFIADSEATKNIADKRSYQITLLKVTAHENCVEITNHFYQSLIKKRIVMLNRNQSKKQNSWKYLLIIPALAAFMFYFQVKVIAQVREMPLIIAKSLQQQSGVQVTVDKNTSDAEMKRDAQLLKKEHGVTLKFSKVKRNSNGEIVAIKCEFKDKNGKKGVSHVSGDEPIKPISFYKNDDGSIGFGNSRDRDMRISRRNAVAGNDEDSFDLDIDDIIPDLPDAPEPPETPGHPAHPGDFEAPEPPAAPGAHPLPPNTKNGKHVIIKRINGEKPMVIIDGEVVADPEKYLADNEPIDGIYAFTYDSNDENVIINSRDIQRIQRDAAKRTREAMKNAKPQMERARRDLDRARVEIDANRQSMRKEDYEQAKREIETAHEEIKRATLELEKEREELNKQREAQQKK